MNCRRAALLLVLSLAGPLAWGDDASKAAPEQQSYDTALRGLTSALSVAATPAQVLETRLAKLRLLAQYRRYAELAIEVARLRDSHPAAEGEPLDQELRVYEAQVDLQHGALTEAVRRLAPLRLSHIADVNLSDSVRLVLADTDSVLGQRDEATRALVALQREAHAEHRALTEARAWQKLAELQLRMFDYAQGRVYYLEALKVAPLWAHQLRAQLEMGVAQMQNMLGERPAALLAIEDVLAQTRRVGDVASEADALLLKGFFLARADRSPEALAPLREALALREGLGNASDVINVLTHLCADLQNAGRGDEALEHCKRGLKMAEGTENAALQWDIHGATAEVHAARGDFSEAYAHLKLSERALLRHSRQQLITQTGALRERFEVERQLTENERLAVGLRHEREDRRQLAFLATALVVLLALLAVATGLLIKLYLKTRRRAERDGLTGLLNRRRVMEMGEAELERARRYGFPVALLAIDIDHFKRVNDSHGHATGDQVLKQVAARLQGALRREDHAGRLGGEEFLIVLPHADADAAWRLAERLRLDVAEHVVVAPEWPVTLSVGVAQWSPGLTLSQTLSLADRALYRAKAEGRHRCVLAEGEPPLEAAPA